jgi:hypothetical protein
MISLIKTIIWLYIRFYQNYKQLIMIIKRDINSIQLHCFIKIINP